jgi:hypothetical protein
MKKFTGLLTLISIFGSSSSWANNNCSVQIRGDVSEPSRRVIEKLLDQAGWVVVADGNAVHTVKAQNNFNSQNEKFYPDMEFYIYGDLLKYKASRLGGTSTPSKGFEKIVSIAAEDTAFPMCIRN